MSSLTIFSRLFTCLLFLTTSLTAFHSVNAQTEELTPLLKKTCPKSPGVSSVRRFARSSVVRHDIPKVVTCATRLSCSWMAESSFGCRCPCTLHHRLETPSKSFWPSVVVSQQPSPYSMTSESWSAICVKPCQ